MRPENAKGRGGEGGGIGVVRGATYITQHHQRTQVDDRHNIYDAHHPSHKMKYEYSTRYLSFTAIRPLIPSKTGGEGVLNHVMAVITSVVSWRKLHRAT